MGLTNFILTCEKDNEELRKDINYYKNMTSRLKKENQELKKQLEERISESSYFDMITDENISNKNQQKEFIEYLENEIKEYDEVVEKGFYFERYKCLKEILSKYKEIIGGDINE